LIFPVLESTLIKCFSKSTKVGGLVSGNSSPEYFQIAGKLAQLVNAEKGVITKFYSLILS
jgi:hypothetical protein